MLHLLFDVSGLYYSFRALFIDGENNIDEALLFLPLIPGLFYWNSEYLIPKFLNRKSWWKYILGLVMSFFFFHCLGQASYEFLVHQKYTFDLDATRFKNTLLIFNFLVIGLSTSIGGAKIAGRNSHLKKAAFKKQKARTSKKGNAPIYPYFLFNTLQTIRNLSETEQAAQTTKTIEKLSAIIQYPLRVENKKTTLLKEEIAFINDYIALHKMQWGEKYPISFEVDEGVGNIEIAPLLFIPFVENAFKYGVNEQEPSSVFIAIKKEKEQLHFQCINEIAKLKDVLPHEKEIENIKTRLDLLYDKKYTLSTKEDGYQYMVDLKISL